MEARLFVQSEMTAAEPIPVAGGVAHVFSARSPDKQTPNEDAAAVVCAHAEAGILAVADGLGGLPAGEQASAVALRALVDSLQESPADEVSFRAAILNGIENANRAVSALGVGAATTLVVAEIQGRSVRTYHVGDSMILLTGLRGKIKLQTVPHSPVGYAVESGLLDEHEALHHEERHLVSNILGATDMRIELGSTVEMARYDTLLLASDGLPDNFPTAEIVEQVRRGRQARMMRSLVAEAHRRMSAPLEGQPGKPDDLTLVTFRFQKPGPC